MTRMLFVSLPVADVARSTAFYEAIGFTRDARFSEAHVAAMVWSEGVTFMLLDTAFYATLTPKRIADTRETSAALFALACDSREAVDAITAAAVAAGGREGHGAEDLGFMYSRAFEDFDGHGFGPVWMDVEAAMRSEATPETVGA